MLVIVIIIKKREKAYSLLLNLIDEYNLELSLFYEDFILPNTNFNEFPIEKLNLLIDQMGLIIENTKKEKELIFDLYEVEKFIEETILKLKKDIL